jgi:hypothetical protein
MYWLELVACLLRGRMHKVRVGHKFSTCSCTYRHTTRYQTCASALEACATPLHTPSRTTTTPSGRSLAARVPVFSASGTPLAYMWPPGHHAEPYLGAAHGLIGILYALLLLQQCAPQCMPDAQQDLADIQAALRCVLVKVLVDLGDSRQDSCHSMWWERFGQVLQMVHMHWLSMSRCGPGECVPCKSPCTAVHACCECMLCITVYDVFTCLCRYVLSCEVDAPGSPQGSGGHYPTLMRLQGYDSSSSSSKTLVHWCHGAPGAVFLCCAAHEVRPRGRHQIVAAVSWVDACAGHTWRKSAPGTKLCVKAANLMVYW